MKIALALSVGEGNGSVKLRASQFTSCEGIDWRGKRAAWLSGPEKSRHRMQTPALEVAPILGFEACSAARSGREDIGIGGGDALVGRSVGRGGGASVDLFMAKLRADLRGGSGCGASFFCVLCREGRGGRSGNDGTESAALDLILVVDREGLKGARGASLSSFVFLRSGSGGRLAGSYSGTLSLGLPSPFVEPCPMLWLVRLDSAEAVDLADMVEATDSMDARLPFSCCSEGRRGGSAGTGDVPPCCEGLGGSDGRTLGLSGVLLWIPGGGSKSPLASGAGWLPIGLVELTPLLRTGGLFVVLARCSAGRLGSGGGGGLAFLYGTACSYVGGGEVGVGATLLRLRAAILSLMDCGCGASGSAIVSVKRVWTKVK